mgnify:CR=1 FL=1
MNKKIIFVLMLIFGISGANAQKHEFANWKRYEQANRELGEPSRKEKQVWKKSVRRTAANSL